MEAAQKDVEAEVGDLAQPLGGMPEGVEDVAPGRFRHPSLLAEGRAHAAVLADAREHMLRGGREVVGDRDEARLRDYGANVGSELVVEFAQALCPVALGGLAGGASERALDGHPSTSAKRLSRFR